MMVTTMSYSGCEFQYGEDGSWTVPASARSGGGIHPEFLPLDKDFCNGRSHPSAFMDGKEGSMGS